MKAIILCGGVGKKMYPYSVQSQKCCLPIGNVPNILRIVRQLKEKNIDEILIFTDYREQQVKNVLRKELEENKNIKLINSPQNKIVSNLLENISEKENDYLIYYGDSYLEIENLNLLLDNYKKNGNSMLVEFNEQNKFKNSDYLGAFVDEENKIKSVYGHSRGNYANSRSCGVFCVDKKTLEKVEYITEFYPKINVGAMPSEDFCFEKCIHLALEDNIKINGVKTIKPYVDLNFPWDIMLANDLYCEEVVGNIKENIIKTNSKISDTAIINGKIILGENSVIGDRVIIDGNCIIGDNTIITNGAMIGANCVIGNNSIINFPCKISSGTVIGNFNKIGYCAEISGVTFDNVSAVHNCQVGGLVGKNVDIASGVQMGALRFDDAVQSQIVNGRKYNPNFGNSVYLGDSVRTGVGNIFYPGVIVGNDSCLGPGLIISKNIEDNKVVIVKQEHEIKEWGPNKYGW